MILGAGQVFPRHPTVPQTLTAVTGADSAVGGRAGVEPWREGRVRTRLQCWLRQGLAAPLLFLSGCITLAPHVTIPPYMERGYNVGFIDKGEPAPARGVFLDDVAWEALKQKFKELDDENRRLKGDGA